MESASHFTHSDSPLCAVLPPERYGAVIHIIPGVAEAIFVVRNPGVPPGEQLATIASLRPPQPGQARAVTLKYLIYTFYVGTGLFGHEYGYAYVLVALCSRVL